MAMLGSHLRSACGLHHKSQPPRNDLRDAAGDSVKRVPRRRWRGGWVDGGLAMNAVWRRLADHEGGRFDPTVAGRVS